MTTQYIPIADEKTPVENPLGKVGFDPSPTVTTRNRATPRMSERHIEQALRKAITADGGLCWKLVSPGLAGVPDRICLNRGRIVFVELKAPGATPRPIQHRRITQLRDHGFTVLVIDHPDQIQEVRDALSAA